MIIYIPGLRALDACTPPHTRYALIAEFGVNNNDICLNIHLFAYVLNNDIRYVSYIYFCTDAYPPTGGYARPFYWFEYANVLDNWARHMDKNLLFIWVFKICRGIADEHASFLYFTTVSMTHRLTKLAPFWFYLFGFRLVPVHTVMWARSARASTAWTEHLALRKYNWLSVLPQKILLRDWCKSMSGEGAKINFRFAYVFSITSRKVHNLPVCALRFSRTIA